MNLTRRFRRFGARREQQKEVGRGRVITMRKLYRPESPSSLPDFIISAEIPASPGGMEAHSAAMPPSPNIQRERTVALRVLTRALLEALENEGCKTPGVSPLDFAAEVRRFEVALIKSALACAGGRQRRAARLLNLKKSTLNAKIKRYAITF